MREKIKELLKLCLFYKVSHDRTVDDLVLLFESEKRAWLKEIAPEKRYAGDEIDSEHDRALRDWNSCIDAFCKRGGI